jgi:hypothetical protein
MAHGFGIGLLALLTVGAGAPLAAQQDQMQHGEMQHGEMQHDGMGQDGMAMDHGMAMLPHGTFAPSGGHRAAGSFAFANEGDRTVLKLGSDFSVEGAPDLYVVLSAGDGLSPGAVFLGQLSKLSGAQTFEVPPGTRLRDFSHVVLWSRKDKVALGAASLAGGGGMMHK